MVSWFFKSGLRQGVFWAIMVYLVCATNDVLMRILGENRLHFVEISFFRFLFSFISIALFILATKQNIKSNLHKMHIERSIIGAISLTMCCLSVNIMPLAENASILFSEAIFMLPLSIIFLHEKVTGKTLIATIIGLIGLLIIYKPRGEHVHLQAFVPTIAAFLFAVQNVFIKKMVDMQESDVGMLFYFSLYTTVIAGVFVPFFWQTPTYQEIFLLALLGIGANLLQLFMFFAYRATSAANLSPLRYTELIFSVIFGFIFFNEIPNVTVITGALFIVIGAFIASYGKHDKCGCC